MPADRNRFVVTGMTRGDCLKRVDLALLSVPGVSGSIVDLEAGTADVTYDSDVVTLAALTEAAGAAGYGLEEAPPEARPQKASRGSGPRTLGLPVVAGAVAAALLTGVYIGIVALFQDLDHALGLIAGDWYLVVPIVAGFGVQIGLFVYVRRTLRRRQSGGSTKALAGAGTGASTISMVACCAHHVTDVLPVLGLSGAALFLNDYRAPIMAVGIIVNGVGIALMILKIRRWGALTPALSQRERGPIPSPPGLG
ncbi:MAG TPA: cation transporter [Dehalococcoidia bacterium]|nr:cation transporter [Dehalococcoidia bacterium]